MRWLFALIMLTSVAFGQSQPTSNQSQNPPQKTEQKSQRGDQDKNVPKPNEGIANYWMMRIATAVIAAPLQKTSTYCTSERANKQDKWLQEFVCDIKITDVVIAIFSVLLVGVTIGLVLVGYIQARRMRVSARQQLRAYLSMEIGTTYRQSRKRRGWFEFRPTVVNNGQTPASKVRILSRIDFVDSAIRADFDYGIANVGAPPGGSVTAIAPGKDKLNRVVFPDISLGPN